MPPALNPMQHMAQEKPEETVNKRKALRWLDIAKYCIIISNGFVWHVCNFLQMLFNLQHTLLISTLMGVRRKFFKGRQSRHFAFFSGCWRCNANRRSRNALFFLHLNENALCYDNSHKNCASLSALLLSTGYNTTWFTAISRHCLAALPAKDGCVQQSHVAKQDCQPILIKKAGPSNKKPNSKYKMDTILQLVSVINVIQFQIFKNISFRVVTLSHFFSN